MKHIPATSKKEMSSACGRVGAESQTPRRSTSHSVKRQAVIGEAAQNSVDGLFTSGKIVLDQVVAMTRRSPIRRVKLKVRGPIAERRASLLAAWARSQRLRKTNSPFASCQAEVAEMRRESGNIKKRETV